MCDLKSRPGLEGRDQTSAQPGRAGALGRLIRSAERCGTVPPPLPNLISEYPVGSMQPNCQSANLDSSGLFSLISLFSQSFSSMEAPAGGLISLFSHKVHSFFAMMPLAAQDRWDALIPAGLFYFPENPSPAKIRTIASLNHLQPISKLGWRRKRRTPSRNHGHWFWTGAPCSPGRTWAENGFFQCSHSMGKDSCFAAVFRPIAKAFEGAPPRSEISISNSNE